MSDLLSSGSDTPSGGPGGFWNNLPPSVRAGLIVAVFLSVIWLINTITVGSSLVFCLPIELALYVANGALAAHFALDSGYATADLPRIGAFAALIGWGGQAITILILGLILGFVTLGGALVGFVGCLACGPIFLAVHAAFGALGAYIYGRYRGPAADTTFV